MTPNDDVTPTTLTTGEAERLLTQLCGDLRRTGGFSRQTVRRLVTSGDLVSSWSRDEVTMDRNGKPIHGHRLITRASVEAYARHLRAGSTAVPDGE